MLIVGSNADRQAKESHCKTVWSLAMTNLATVQTFEAPSPVLSIMEGPMREGIILLFTVAQPD